MPCAVDLTTVLEVRFLPLGSEGDLKWMAHAMCRDSHPSVFFPLDEAGARHARAVCARCPVRAECLAFAVRNGLHDGIWGGTSERERRAMRVGRPVERQPDNAGRSGFA